jgi:hypothetical protein
MQTRVEVSNLNEMEIKYGSVDTLDQIFKQPIIPVIQIEAIRFCVDRLNSQLDPSDIKQVGKLELINKQIIMIEALLTRNDKNVKTTFNNILNKVTYTENNDLANNANNLFPHPLEIEEVLVSIMNMFPFHERLHFQAVSKKFNTVINEMPQLDPFIWYSEVIVCTNNLKENYETAQSLSQIRNTIKVQDHITFIDVHNHYILKHKTIYDIFLAAVTLIAIIPLLLSYFEETYGEVCRPRYVNEDLKTFSLVFLLTVTSILSSYSHLDSDKKDLKVLNSIKFFRPKSEVTGNEEMLQQNGLLELKDNVKYG